jgi:hypothetical protein
MVTGTLGSGHEARILPEFLVRRLRVRIGLGAGDHFLFGEMGDRRQSVLPLLLVAAEGLTIFFSVTFAGSAG